MIGSCVKYFINAVLTYFLDWWATFIGPWFGCFLALVGVGLSWWLTCSKYPVHTALSVSILYLSDILWGVRDGVLWGVVRVHGPLMGIV
ncbi:MAG: hypothetical protein ACP5NQ_06240 [Vulcanisaeta sp.]